MATSDSYGDTSSNNVGDGEINSPEFNDSNKSKVKAISNGMQALAIAVKLQVNDLGRDIRRSRVLGAFNGNPPYDDRDLLNLGQAYRYNVSWGFEEGVIGRGVVPYNDLSINIADLIEVDSDLPDSKNKVVQMELGNTINKWGRWPKTITRLNQDLLLNGYNTMAFPSDYDPFPTFIPQMNGFVDEATPNEVADLECFVWKKSYLIHELYNKISDPDVAKKAGWDVQNVRLALEAAMPEDILANSNNTSGRWTAVESQIRAAAQWASIVGAKMVDTFHVFATELDGTVTHYIVLSTYTGEGVDGPTLFCKEGRFDSMRDWLVYFDLETGDGTWHGSRGLGQRVFNTHKAIDKVVNSLLDQAFVSGLTLLQPGDQSSQEAFTTTVVGPFCIVPNDITINPAVLPAISQTAFQVHQLLTGASEQRIGDVVPQIQYQPNQAAETATAAKIAASRQIAVTQGNLKRYIDPIGQVVSIMLRRLLKKNSPNPYAKEFQKNLEKKGLTDDDIKKIRGARNVGNIQDILGNTAQNTQIIFSEFRGDPDVDQQVLKQKRIASVLDADAADELLISDKDQTREIEAMRQQEIELTTILSGMPVPVSARDNHEAHLRMLFEWVGRTIQQAAAQPNPQVIPLLKAVISHGEAHLGFLEKDKTKKGAAKEAKEKLKDAVDAVKTMEKSALKIAKASIDQAAQLAQTPEEQAQVQQAQAQLQQV